MSRSESEMPPSMARVVGEIRRQPEPELDWERIEHRLMSDLEAGRRPRYSSPTRGPALVGVLGLAAAAVLGVVAYHQTRMPSTSAPESTVASDDTGPRTLSGSDLEVGQRLTTGATPLAVEHPGLGRWVLQPQSSGEVRANAETVVVQLQSGGLSAEIVPSARPETFVVEVGKVRVAVHGTQFSVRRDADQAYVVVREGVVGVSTSGQPGQTLLEAPASGRFHLVGHDAGKTLEASGKVRPVARPVRERPEKASPVQPKLPNEPSFSDVQTGLAEVETILKQCLVESTTTHGKVSVTLETRVSLRIDGEGSIAAQHFAPPLAPALQDCARQRFESVRFARSVVGAHVIRDLAIDLE